MWNGSVDQVRTTVYRRGGSNIVLGRRPLLVTTLTVSDQFILGSCDDSRHHLWVSSSPFDSKDGRGMFKENRLKWWWWRRRRRRRCWQWWRWRRRERGEDKIDFF